MSDIDWAACLDYLGSLGAAAELKSGLEELDLEVNLNLKVELRNFPPHIAVTADTSGDLKIHEFERKSHEIAEVVGAIAEKYLFKALKGGYSPGRFGRPTEFSREISGYVLKPSYDNFRQ